MERRVDILALRSVVKVGRIEWQRHALERMAERGIAQAEVKATLLRGERVEDYPDAYPLPAVLLLGWRGKRPLHVVAAYDDEAATAYVTTAYEPTSEHFEPDFRIRRRT